MSIELYSTNGSNGRNGKIQPAWTPPSFFPEIRRALDAGVLKSNANPGLRAAEDILGLDPSNRIAGMPPNYGQYMLPHVTTFMGLFGTFSRVYRVSDEALNDSWENARYMRNDVGIMECLEQRKRMTALLPWHLEPEDEKSPEQVELAAAVEKIIRRISRFVQLAECLLDAIWFGRYGVQFRFGWQSIGGRQYVMPCPLRDDPGWKPVHGDKLVWRYDDGSGKYITDQVGIRVGQKLGKGSKINQRWEIEPTDRGLAYFLADWERALLAIHRHTVEDGAFEDPMQAGMVHGVGIRHRIYWEWYQKQEALAFLMEFLQRSAGGIEIHYYPSGNPQAKARAEEAVKYRIANGRNVMMYPREPGDDANLFGVEFVEPGLAGIESLKQLLTEYFGHRIKRYILGQTLSSEAASTGLGSGVADLHYDTLQQIIRYDAINLEQTLTDDLVKTIQHWNFPKSKGIYLKFKIETEVPDMKDRMEAFQAAYEIGCRLDEREVMETIGATIPGPDDAALQNPQIAQAQAAGAQGIGFGPGTKDAGAAPEPTPPEELEEELAQRLLPSPDDAGPGQIAYANEAGEWVEKRMPEFDTGERFAANEGSEPVVMFRRAKRGEREFTGNVVHYQDKSLRGSLGIPRKEMPQIVKAELPKFLKWLESEGVDFTRETVEAKTLKPTEPKVDSDKVEAIRKVIADKGLDSLEALLVSQDDYIADGHHRWQAQKQRKPDAKVKIIRVDLPIKELLDKADEFSGVSKEDETDTDRRIERTRMSRRLATRIVRYRMKPGRVKRELVEV